MIHAESVVRNVEGSKITLPFREVTYRMLICTGRIVSVVILEVNILMCYTDMKCVPYMLVHYNTHLQTNYNR